MFTADCHYLCHLFVVACYIIAFSIFFPGFLQDPFEHVPPQKEVHLGVAKIPGSQEPVCRMSANGKLVVWIFGIQLKGIVMKMVPPHSNPKPPGCLNHQIIINYMILLRTQFDLGCYIWGFYYPVIFRDYFISQLIRIPEPEPIRMTHGWCHTWVYLGFP